jgi:hypothetical protein
MDKGFENADQSFKLLLNCRQGDILSRHLDDPDE